jgi:hypothetical protein
MKKIETYVFIYVLFSYALMRSSLRVALPMSAPLSPSSGGLTHRIDRERGGQVSYIADPIFAPSAGFVSCCRLSRLAMAEGREQL